MTQVLQPIPAPLSSPVWYEDFVSTTQPVNYNPETHSSSEPEQPTNDNDEQPEEEVPVAQSVPEFEPVFGTNSDAQNQGTRKSSRVPVPPTWLKDYVTPKLSRANQVSVTPLQSQFQVFLCALLAQTAPTYFKEAVKIPAWCTAMNVEIKALEENGTWEVTTLPKDKKAIDCHWIFKIKYNADGSEDKKKARLVVNGNRQKKGVDYEETFAPVAKMVTVRALLAIAAMKVWKTRRGVE